MAPAAGTPGLSELLPFQSLISQPTFPFILQGPLTSSVNPPRLELARDISGLVTKERFCSSLLSDLCALTSPAESEQGRTFGGNLPEQGACLRQAGEGGRPLQRQPACPDMSFHCPFLRATDGGQHSPGARGVVPAAGRKDSVHANSLIESSFEGKLVQPQIKTDSKMCRT